MNPPKKKLIHKKKPVSLPQPPMIRLRLPSEKPTREDGDVDGTILAFVKSGSILRRGWMTPFPEGFEIVAWLPGRLPDGILPREPSQEEKWRKEFDEEWERSLKGRFLHVKPQEMAWQGFFAAKKGGEK